MQGQPLLSADSITKSYAGVRALAGVSFDLFPGEVHALVGENGAGKSTLIKVMAGAVVPDSGTLSISGVAHRAISPAEARALGIAVIYQQPSLFPQLTVAENIAFALEARRAWRVIDWNRRRRDARDLLERVGSDIDPDRLVESLSMPEQQIVEIAKAVGSAARVVIMDEPTASLSEREVAKLFDIVARLKAQGVGLIYISHRLEEILSIADRVTVLRDGRTVSTQPRAGLERSSLINLMIGRELSAIYPKRGAVHGDVALELRHVTSRAGGVHDVSLEVRSGEIVGLSGLVGSGRTELARILFGLTPKDSGEVFVHGRRVDIQSPAGAIDEGIGYLPEDRGRHGVVPEMTIAHNVSLARLSAVARNGFIDARLERDQAQHYVDRLSIKAPAVASEVESLSGGNQQKVAFARWLTIDPKVLIVDEPTQGVDVGSKAEIHALLQDVAARGVAVLMISSDLPEILGMSDRIAVMRGGAVAGVLSGRDATQERVLAMALGH